MERVDRESVKETGRTKRCQTVMTRKSSPASKQMVAVQMWSVHAGVGKDNVSILDSQTSKVLDLSDQTLHIKKNNIEGGNRISLIDLYISLSELKYQSRGRNFLKNKNNLWFSSACFCQRAFVGMLSSRSGAPHFCGVNSTSNSFLIDSNILQKRFKQYKDTGNS